MQKIGNFLLYSEQLPATEKWRFLSYIVPGTNVRMLTNTTIVPSVPSNTAAVKIIHGISRRYLLEKVWESD